MKIPRLELPLLAKLILALAAMGFLPLAIAFFQLQSNEEALLEQVQRTHILAAKTTAARVDAYLSPIVALARSLGDHEAMSAAAPEEIAELLRATLSARSEIAGIELKTAAGETIVAAQRREIKAALAFWAELKSAEPLLLLRGERPFLRVRQELRSGDFLLVWAEAAALDGFVQPLELGAEAKLVLATRKLEVLSGPPLEEIPPEMLEQAQGGKIASACRAYRQAQGDLVVAFAQLQSAPWFVLSRQPAQVAELARQRIKEASLRSIALAVLLTLILSAIAFWSVIQPLRRLASAQRQLLGVEKSSSSEISELEATFGLLQARVKNREEVGGIYIGRYKITNLIGSGAMGSVFRAWDEKLKRAVALKTVHLGSAEIDRDKLLRSLRDEAAITARIHQPNIVTVYDIEEEGLSAFIAMEFVDGVNLQSLLDTRKKIPAADMVPIAMGIARGLATAHESGLVHHDIKPANILLGFDCSVKLTDFGVSQLITSSTRAKNVICGTPGYLAPECFEGGTYSPASDLFALGVVIYECLVGRHPFRAETLNRTVGLTLSLDPEPLSDLDLSIPIEVSRIVEELMAKDPADRPNKAALVVERLEQIAIARNWKWQGKIEEVQNQSVGRHSGAPTRLLTMTLDPAS